MIEINLTSISDFVSNIKDVTFTETSDFFYRTCKIDNADLNLVNEINSNNEG